MPSCLGHPLVQVMECVVVDVVGFIFVFGVVGFIFVFGVVVFASLNYHIYPPLISCVFLFHF